MNHVELWVRGFLDLCGLDYSMVGFLGGMGESIRGTWASGRRRSGGERVSRDRVGLQSVGRDLTGYLHAARLAIFIFRVCGYTSTQSSLIYTVEDLWTRPSGQ